MQPTPPRIGPATFALALLAALSLQGIAKAQDIRRFPRADLPGTAWAVRVDDASLAYTGPILPWDASGAINADVRAQASQAVANLKAVLAGMGGDAANVVRINVSVTRDDVSAAVDEALAAAFGGNPPVVTIVRSPVGEAGAVLALDAIVRMPGSDAGVKRILVPSLPGAASGVRVAVLPPGEKVFISGLAQRSKDFDSGAVATMAALGRDLQYLGLEKADVVQVKAVVRPFARRAALERAVADFFAGALPPPLVMVEGGPPDSVTNEIEMTASGARNGAKPAARLAYGTFPGNVASSRFSNFSIVAPGVPLIFIAGLGGDAASDSRGQIEETFSRLGKILFETGSSYSSLVKSSGYFADKVAGKALSEIRGVYYNPAALPAATITPADGVGRPGRTCTLDMIAAPAAK